MARSLWTVLAALLGLALAGQTRTLTSFTTASGLTFGDFDATIAWLR